MWPLRQATTSEKIIIASSKRETDTRTRQMQKTGSAGPGDATPDVTRGPRPRPHMPPRCVQVICRDFLLNNNPRKTQLSQNNRAGPALTVDVRECL